jgi:hypothetical protein
VLKQSPTGVGTCRGKGSSAVGRCCNSVQGSYRHLLTPAPASKKS